MLRSVEITAVLAVPAAPFHNLHWTNEIELTLDCFVCERVGRTTSLVRGQDRASCSGSRSGAGPHPAPARIAAFGHSAEKDRITLHAVVDFWFAPFEDAERGTTILAPTGSWVRLNLGYLCPDGRRSGSFSTQTNTGRPHTLHCEQCSAAVAESREVPRIRHLT